MPDGSDELKHVAHCCVALKCFVWWYTLFIFQKLLHWSFKIFFMIIYEGCTESNVCVYSTLLEQEWEVFWYFSTESPLWSTHFCQHGVSWNMHPWWKSLLTSCSHMCMAFWSATLLSCSYSVCTNVGNNKPSLVMNELWDSDRGALNDSVLMLWHWVRCFQLLKGLCCLNLWGQAVHEERFCLDCVAAAMTAFWSFETLGTARPVTHHHIPVELNL